jgi:dTDP-L-rhamnose 4-epimerase
VELQVGDVRDPAAIAQALLDVDRVCHLAAAVGVGQSMYEIAHYTAVNNLGTAVLLEALIHRPVERLVVASSMSIYGEGLYRSVDGALIADARRSISRLRAGEWEPLDASDRPLEPMPTPETKTPSLQSVYALSKFDQERLCLLTGRAYGIPTTALRFFNTYGPRQALGNPYTGVLAIFAARFLAGKAPVIYEDGLQRRDFVSVHDVARACRLALESNAVADDPLDAVFNVGSGEHHTVRDICTQLADLLGSSLRPTIEGAYRAGDIRHCYADLSRAAAGLGYAPTVSLAAGMTELVGWLEEQRADRDTLSAAELDRAQAELVAKGLVTTGHGGLA